MMRFRPGFRRLSKLFTHRSLNINAFHALSRVRLYMLNNASISANVKIDFFDVVDAFQEEIISAKDEVSSAIKTAKAEVMLATSQTIAAKDEVSSAIKTAKAEVMLATSQTIAAKDELKEDAILIARLRAELKEYVREVLRARGELSVRGALEFIRSSLSALVKRVDTSVEIKEPMDPVFSAFNNDDGFQEKFRKVCDQKKAGGKFCGRLLASIWSVASKPYHGPQDEVCIRAQSYSPEECLVLVALFEYKSIPFTYRNLEDVKVDYYTGNPTLI